MKLSSKFCKTGLRVATQVTSHERKAGTTRSLLLGAVVATLSLVALAPTVAMAQPTKGNQVTRTAAEWFKEGDDQYNLGNFAGAVEAFKKAFETEIDLAKKPAYLYNIAQAYRLAKDCKNSLFFYKRFMALRGNDTARPLKPAIRAEVDGRIIELEACVKQQDASAAKQPDTIINPDGTKPDGTKPDGTEPNSTKPDGTKPNGTKPDGTAPDSTKPDGDGDGDGDGDPVDGTANPAPVQHLAIRIGGGIGIPIIPDTSSRLGPTGTISVGYLLPVTAPVALEVGAGFSFASVGFDLGGNAGEEHGRLMSLFAFGAATKKVTSAISIRGELGVGAGFFAGLTGGNPYTVGALTTDGPLTMALLRAAVAVNYAMTPKIGFWVSPLTFSYSPTPDSNFRADVSMISRIDFLAGVQLGL